MLFALVILFYWLVTPLVSYFSAKGYLINGSMVLLYISAAFLVGLPFSIFGALASASPNLSVTFAALGLLISSAFQLLGATQASFGSVPVEHKNRKLRILLVLGGVLVLSLLSLLATYFGVLPPFFEENLGTTLIDQLAYTFIITFFLLGSLLYLRLYFKTKSKTLYMYSLGLMLYSIGTFGLTQQLVFGDVVVWLGRATTYVGLLYFLYAFWSSRQKATQNGAP